MKGIHSVLIALLVAWLTGDLFGGVFSAGGGESSGDGYLLSGTIGQPLYEISTNGQFVLRSGFRNVVLQVRINATAESYTNWMSSLPLEDQPPTDQQDPSDTPAGDGVPNIFKYTAGLLPMVPSREGYPRFVEYPDPDKPDQLLLAIGMIRSSTANVRISMEGSPDMLESSWTDVSYIVEVVEDLGDDRERIQLLTSISLLPSEKYFLRLNIELP